MSPHQYELALPPRRTPAAEMPPHVRERLYAAYAYKAPAEDADKLREKIAEICEQLNAEQCPELRVELAMDLRDLRARLAKLEGGQ
jgi:hypothetical protein